MSSNCQHSNTEEAPCSLLWEGEVKKETRDGSGRAFETIGEETHSSVLWTGEVQLQLSETKRQIFAPFTIRHKDNSRDGCRLFDWTSGKAIWISVHLQLNTNFSGITSVQATRYPMKVLGGKSQPELQNLKQYIKVGSTTQHPKYWSLFYKLFRTLCMNIF